MASNTATIRAMRLARAAGQSIELEIGNQTHEACFLDRDELEFIPVNFERNDQGFKHFLLEFQEGVVASLAFDPSQAKWRLEWLPKIAMELQMERQYGFAGSNYLSPSLSELMSDQEDEGLGWFN